MASFSNSFSRFHLRPSPRIWCRCPAVYIQCTISLIRSLNPVSFIVVAFDSCHSSLHFPARYISYSLSLPPFLSMRFQASLSDIAYYSTASIFTEINMIYRNSQTVEPILFIFIIIIIYSSVFKTTIRCLYFILRFYSVKKLSWFLGNSQRGLVFAFRSNAVLLLTSSPTFNRRAIDCNCTEGKKPMISTAVADKMFYLSPKATQTAHARMCTCVLGAVRLQLPHWLVHLP